MAQKVFLNDGIVDSSQAHINCADGGFLYGAGLFETMRASNGVVFALDDHLGQTFHKCRKTKNTIFEATKNLSLMRCMKL